MTGGTEMAGRINRNLAAGAERDGRRRGRRLAAQSVGGSGES